MRPRTEYLIPASLTAVHSLLFSSSSSPDTVKLIPHCNPLYYLHFCIAFWITIHHSFAPLFPALLCLCSHSGSALAPSHRSLLSHFVSATIMSSQMDFDELIAVAEYTYGSESSEMNQAMVSTPSNHSHIAPTPVYSHNFAPTLTYATNVLSTSMDSHSMAPSSANYPMESLEFEPVIMDHLAIDPALSNGSSTESSYFDLSMTDDSFINNSLDGSVSPPTADPTVDQPQSGLLSPALDRRMDLYPVPGGVVPTTAGMEQWIAGFDPEFQLKVFQVIGKLFARLKGVLSSN